MKKEYGDYYLGLDIGTDSVGWAITDPEYNILEFNRKAMWGIHLFKSGNTAEERRIHRCSRRRLQRRNERLSLLRELFDSEITPIDPSFFERMKESNLYAEDRKDHQKNSLFNNPKCGDASLHKKYPTIYHLRRSLMTTNEKPDIRLVYLAIHHILKNRGHFLFEGLSDTGDVPEFEPLYSEMTSRLSEEVGIEISASENIPEIKSVILDRDLTINDKKRKLRDLMSCETAEQKAIADLLSGALVSADKIFQDPEYKDLKISFKGTGYEDSREEFENALSTQLLSLIDLMKQIYDWGILSSLLSGCKYFSDVKIHEYEQHKSDLKLLKKVLRGIRDKNTDGKDIYHDVLKSEAPNNYCAYSGMLKSVDPAKMEKCNQEAFCKYLKTVLADYDFDQNNETKDMKLRIENSTFMPKQRSSNNSVIPNSLHRKELKAILDNVSKFYPFLNVKDVKGIAVRDKIEKLCTFRIPYYVGPLNPQSDKAWAVHKNNNRVLPWNMEDVIDIEKTSQGFIDRLISTCTYLDGEPVIPKNSTLYSRFMLYNELNSMSVEGERIDPLLKISMVHDLFEKENPGKITVKKLSDYVSSKTGLSNVKIEGIDGYVKSNLNSEMQLRRILGDLKGKQSSADDIVRLVTIYGDDRKRLRAVLTDKYKETLSKDQIESLSKLKYSDWGRLSEKMLTGICHTWPDGRSMNIITAMEQTGNNLMELLSKKYTYLTQIKTLNDQITGKGDGKITCDMVSDLYCSPAVKHGIWRSLSVVQDLLKITGHAPKKVFIETTREDMDIKKRTESRKDALIKLYSNCKSGDRDWLGDIESTDAARFRGKKLYSYYTQMGVCMYCGKKIDLNDLGNKDVCDMDHIYPQSKVTDDSIHNNMVLACRECNATKSDRYPISENIQNKMKSHWKYLLENKLITDEKYKRLTRCSGFTDDELDKFIARQLVETSQSVKAVAKIMEHVFAKTSDIVYVKANNVSKFRNDYGFIKCRNVNDYHHAKDAYLNIVVGNVYDIKFTGDPMYVIKNREKYNMRRVFDFDVTRNGTTAWRTGEDGTIALISKYMRRNNATYTRYPYKESGQLYDVTLMKKGLGQQPIKNSLPIEKYGGYNKVSGSYFSLVEHTVKGKRVRTIESVPVMNGPEALSESALDEYFTKIGLLNPDVRIRCIRIDSMFEINGFRASISGRTGNSIMFMCGEQLLLSDDLYNYCKKLYNFGEALKETRNTIKAANYDISADNNVALYDTLINKLGTKYGALQILSTQEKTLKKCYKMFMEKDLNQQGTALNNILHIFQCNPMGMDISAIGGPKNAGRILMSNNLSSYDSILMINSSPSGLFESKTDLKNI